MSIKIKGSNVSGRTPLPADLLERQLAVNTADGYLFTKHSDGTIKDIKTKVADLATNATTASTCTGNSATVTNGVYTTGDQTIAGVKTFSSSPIAPTPTVGDNSTQLATTAFVKAKSEADSIGVGQTWQDVTASRTAGVAYANTTGKPIFVQIAHTVVSGNTSQVSPDGITWTVVTVSSASGGNNGSFIVPDGWYYKSANINFWRELQ
jgi:hypothetical protein